MNKLIYLGIAALALSTQSVFAQKMGVLGEDQKPNHLVQASEFESFLAFSNSNNSASLDNELRWRRGWSNPYRWGWSRPYRWNWGWGWRRWTQDPAANDSQGLADRSQATEDSSSVSELSQTPVACFAMDASGNYYADVDFAFNVSTTQQNVNNECLASDSNCTQNLGCAVTTNSE